VTPKNGELGRPDNVTIVRRDRRRLHGSEPTRPTQNRVNAPNGLRRAELPNGKKLRHLRVRAALIERAGEEFLQPGPLRQRGG
jgi:hypothetical protein